MIYRPTLLPTVQSKRMRQSAKGMPCTARISSVAGLSCTGEETTVLAHLPGYGGGVAAKNTDLGALYACYQCHELIDNRLKSDIHNDPEYWQRLLFGLQETHALMLGEGIISVAGA